MAGIDIPIDLRLGQHLKLCALRPAARLMLRRLKLPLRQQLIRLCISVADGRSQSMQSLIHRIPFYFSWDYCTGVDGEALLVSSKVSYKAGVGAMAAILNIPVILHSWLTRLLFPVSRRSVVSAAVFVVLVTIITAVVRWAVRADIVQVTACHATGWPIVVGPWALHLRVVDEGTLERVEELKFSATAEASLISDEVLTHSITFL